MKAPNLSDVARAALKGMIVSLANAGLVTGADAEKLIEMLELGDA
jgi:hypothetical protein